MVTTVLYLFVSRRQDNPWFERQKEQRRSVVVIAWPESGRRVVKVGYIDKRKRKKEPIRDVAFGSTFRSLPLIFQCTQ